MKKQIYNNMLWNAFGNIVYLGCQWIVTILVTRLAGFKDAGVLSLAMSISATFQTIALFGVRNYQVSDIQGKYTNSCYVGTRIFTCAVAFIICMIFSLISGYNFYQIMTIFWFMLYRLAENFSDVLHGIAQNNDRLDIAGKSFVIKGIETLIFFLIGFYLLKGLNGGLFLMALGSIATTVFYDFVSVQKVVRFDIKISFSESLQLIKETIPLCVNLFLMAGMSTVPRYILEKMCDEIALGAYSSIFAPALLIQSAAVYIFNPFSGAFASFYKNKNVNEFWRLVIKLCSVVACLELLIIVFALLFGDKALAFLFGDLILEYTYLFIPILLCAFLNSYLAFFGLLSTIVRNFKDLVIGYSIGFMTCLLLTPVTINLAGVNGASYSLIIADIVSCIFIFIKLKRLVRLR